MMLNSITFENYRSIRQLHVDLKPINVLFGPNGSGKSTFLQGLAFLRDSVKEGLDKSLVIAGGASAIRSFGLEQSSLSSVSVQSGDHIYKRWVTRERDPLGKESLEKIHPSGNGLIFHSDGLGLMGPHVTDDVITSSRWPLNETLWRSLFREGLHTTIDRDSLISLPGFYNHLLSTRSFNCRRLDIATLGERGSPSTDSDIIGTNGQNLWSVLRNLREAIPTRRIYSKIQECLRTAFPAFDDFELRTLAQTVLCNVGENGQSEIYPVSMAADGLFQLTLCLTALFIDKELPTTIILDEPDLSLHPWALSVLADAIKEATSNWNRQVIIATHSPTLLSEFKEDEILLMQSGENGVTATRVSELQEERRLLERYDLGSLYYMNLIGKQGDKPLYHEVDAPQ